jgi:hypothetical protein
MKGSNATFTSLECGGILFFRCLPDTLLQNQQGIELPLGLDLRDQLGRLLSSGCPGWLTQPGQPTPQDRDRQQQVRGKTPILL